MFKTKKSERSWHCLLDPLDGIGYVAIPENMDISGASSGETTLFVPGLVAVDGKLVVNAAESAEPVFGHTSSRQRGRDLFQVSGAKTMTVVRVTCSPPSGPTTVVTWSESRALHRPVPQR